MNTVFGGRFDNRLNAGVGFHDCQVSFAEHPDRAGYTTPARKAIAQGPGAVLYNQTASVAFLHTPTAVEAATACGDGSANCSFRTTSRTRGEGPSSLVAQARNCTDVDQSQTVSWEKAVENSSTFTVEGGLQLSTEIGFEGFNVGVQLSLTESYGTSYAETTTFSRQTAIMVPAEHRGSIFLTPATETYAGTATAVYPGSGIEVTVPWSVTQAVQSQARGVTWAQSALTPQELAACPTDLLVPAVDLLVLPGGHGTAVPGVHVVQTPLDLGRLVRPIVRTRRSHLRRRQSLDQTVRARGGIRRGRVPPRLTRDDVAERLILSGVGNHLVRDLLGTLGRRVRRGSPDEASHSGYGQSGSRDHLVRGEEAADDGVRHGGTFHQGQDRRRRFSPSLSGTAPPPPPDEHPDHVATHPGLAAPANRRKEPPSTSRTGENSRAPPLGPLTQSQVTSPFTDGHRTPATTTRLRNEAPASPRQGTPLHPGNRSGRVPKRPLNEARLRCEVRDRPLIRLAGTSPSRQGDRRGRRLGSAMDMDP